MENAHLDRRVAIQVQGENVVQPLSQLRGQPYVVLLGEPGAGKSTALEHEAVAEGGDVASLAAEYDDKINAVING